MTHRNETTYTVARTTLLPELNGLWDGPAWSSVTSLHIRHFHPQSSNHRPVTDAKLLHDGRNIHVLFRVRDRYVRSVVTTMHGPVCQDSCVEFFLRPQPDKGYFNFEINAGGTLHASYIEDWKRLPDGRFAESKFLKPELAREVSIFHSLPDVIEPEIANSTEWFIECCVPLPVLERCVGAIGPLHGQEWRANFYKCGDRTSRPHWASWAPIGTELNFHAPEFFAPLRFASA